MPSIEPDPTRPAAAAEHERLLREAAAAARERPLLAGAPAPVPLWVVTVAGLVAVLAGGVLGGAGRLFDYRALVRPGYVRALPEGAAASAPRPMPALDAYLRRGEKVFALCAVCHGAEGKGDGANYPPLAGSAWATGPTERFAMIVLNGLEGPTSTGKAYAVPMPPQGVGMSAADLAGVMTYVRNRLGNQTGDVVSVAQAQAALEVSAARKRAPLPVNAEELDAAHNKDLEGEPVAADAPVNPGTLRPLARPEPGG